MKTQAAVLYEIETPVPYTKSRPLVLEEVILSALGPGGVLVEIAVGLCHSYLWIIDGSRPRVIRQVVRFT